MAKDNEIKVHERVFEVSLPRGRAGRKATNFVLKKVSSGEQNISSVLDLTTDETFLDSHLASFVGGEENAKYIDENGSDGDLFALIMRVVEDVSKAFQTEEVEAALKN